MANKFVGGDAFTVQDFINFCNENQLPLSTPVTVAAGYVELITVNIEEIKVIKNNIVIIPFD